MLKLGTAATWRAWSSGPSRCSGSAEESCELSSLERMPPEEYAYVTDMAVEHVLQPVYE